MSKMIFLKQLCMNFKTSTKFIHVASSRYKIINSSSIFYEISPSKLVFPCQYLQRKYGYYSFKGDDTDSDIEDIECKRDIKDMILPNNNDVLTAKISEAKSLKDVFELIQNNNHQLNWKNISMATAMIREFQIMYYRTFLFEKNLSNSILEDNFQNILTNDHFLNLLNLLEVHHKYMDIQCLSYCSICLYKIGVDSNCTIYQKLLLRLNEMLMTTPINEIPSCVLSRFTVSVISQRDLSGLFVMKNIWPIILEKINVCDTYEDLKHISMCLYHLPWFMINSTMDDFIKKVEKTLLNNKPQDSEKIKCTVHVLKLLNSPYVSTQNINLIRSLLLDLQGVIHNITLYDLVQLQMIILKQYEPYQLFEEIHQVTSEYLSKAESDTDISVLRLLTGIVPSSSPSRRKHIESLLKKQFFSNNNFPLFIGPLFNIIKNLKTSDVNLCNAYWSSVVNWLNSKKSHREYYKLLRLCSRYMNFNNNMAGSYRHFAFENHMIKWLNEELDQGVSGIIPSRYSKIFSFFVSYPNANIGFEIPEVMVKKVLNSIGQYNIFDCYIISRSLNTAFLNRKKKTSLPMFLDQYVRLCTALNKRSLEILNQEPNLNINQLNSLFRGYNHRLNVNEPELFYKILDRYKNFKYEEFSSKNIREITYNLFISDWYDAEIMNKCLEYYLKNYKYLLAENTEKLLSLFFVNGVNSESFVEFLPHAAEIINRDKLNMSGLNFMRASLALCYYYSLPKSITDYLFSVEFLEKLDDELNNCYSKTTYPIKVRQMLMVINRAVCIDCPEFDVPWFHTKYCEEIQSLVHKNLSSFYLDVERKLNQLIYNNGHLKTNHFSPYGYKLDFEINLNTSKRTKNNNQNEKICVLLLTENDLRKTDNEIKGYLKLKQRHLEILGYRVIWIKKSIWNSMFMTEPEAKLSYLKSLIWSEP